MLSTSIIEEIERLLVSGGMSQRAIADRLGVSRGTVNRVANGHRTADQVVRGVLHSTSANVVLPQRCAGCGYRVYVPCRICAARRRRARHRALASAVGLHGHHQRCASASAFRQATRSPGPRHAA